MMNDPVNPNHIGDGSVASRRMTTQSSPPSLAPKTAQRTSLGHRLQRALTGGSNRRFPGLHPSPGGAVSLSPFLNRRLALPILAILALLAASLLFLLTGSPLQAQDDGTIEYAENGTDPVVTFTAVDPEGTVVKWSLAVNDAAGEPLNDDASDFSIDGGVLSFKKSPNYEKATGGGPADADVLNTYSVTVVATDATRRAKEKVVTVNVTNVDEPGTVKLTTLAPRAGIPLTASVTDPDSDPDDNVTGKTWQWAKSQNGTSGWADIDEKATASTYTPADDDGTYYLRATVTYKDAESASDAKTAQVVSANQVKAARSGNEAPEFTDEQATREVAENTAAGEAIGDPIVAEDDDNDVLTYTLYDADGGDMGHSALFAIDWATGQLKTKDKLDFEADDDLTDVMIDEVQAKGYIVVVRATDPDGKPEVAMGDIEVENSDEITVTIIVTNVEEAPDVTGDAAISFAENAGDIDDPLGTGAYMATDPEDATPNLTLVLAGADKGDFTFVASELKFAAQPDYENPGDANKDNVYEVTVEATDAVGLIGTKDVKITVTNMDDPGAVALSHLQPRVGVAITASVTDPDGDVSNVTWQWYRSTAGADSFTEIPKAMSATYKPVTADFAPRMDLRATAMYADGQGNDKTAMGTSANAVDEDTRNRAPVFDDQDDDTAGVQNETATREVAENTEAIVADDSTSADSDTTDNVGNPVTATDPDPNSDALVYTLSGPDAASFRVRQDDVDTTGEDQNEGGQIEVAAGTKLDYETKQTYSVTLKAADSFGDYATIMVTIMVTPVNEAPPVMGEATVEYDENRMDPVATYTAVDPEGTVVKWSLAVNDAAGEPLNDDASDFSIDGGVLSFKKSPNYEKATGGGPADADVLNTYSVTVVATDATRRAKEKVVTVNVTNVDEPGTVKLTTLAPRAGIALTASVTDPDGNVTGMTWQWAKSRNGTSGWADIDEKATASIYEPVDDDGTYYLRATVTYKDPESASDAKTAQVVSANQVKAARSQNDAPEFTDEQATREVAENTAAGEAIGDPIVAEDDDNDVLTYTLYDADGGDMGHSALFAIDWATGQLKTKDKLDFEADDDLTDVMIDEVQAKGYIVVVRATDPDGKPEVAMGDIEVENSDEITVTIIVTNVEEAPDVTGDAALTFPEGTAVNTSLNTVTYTAEDPEDATPNLTLVLAGADKGDFTLNNGTLMFTAVPDYENPGDANKDNVYEVTVEATDAVGLIGTKDVKITVTNADDPGAVALSQLQPRVGVAITASVTDPDGDVSNVTWQWYRSTAGADSFTEIPKAMSATYKPVTADFAPRMDLRATAMYADGQGNDKTAMGTSANAVDEDTRNRAPVFDDQDDDTAGVQNETATREVAENTEAIVADDSTSADSDTTDNVGNPVTATDPDPNSDALVYTLSGPDAASFRVRQDDVDTVDTVDVENNEGGQIEVAAGTKLDYETKQTYMVTLKAEDSFGDYATIDVTIMVTNVDEEPKISEGGLAITGMISVEYAENGTDAVATYTASGPDADSATWTLGGADAGDFEISNAGMLTFRTTPNYEAPADAGTDNVYQVTVEANDGTNTATKAVTIMVTDVDEDGMVTLSSQTPVVGIALTASLTDADGEITGMKWQWAYATVMDGTYSNITGATSDSYTPVEEDANMHLRATASYTDGHGPEKTAIGRSESAVTDVDEAERTRDEIRLEIEDAILAAVLSDGIDDAERSAIEQLILEFALTPSS